MVYHTSEAENPIDILNLASLEGRVKERMEAGAFGYICGGAEDEWTISSNRTADCGSNVVLSGSNICYKRSKYLERSAMAKSFLDFHISCDLVQRHVARSLDHNLNILLPCSFG